MKMFFVLMLLPIHLTLGSTPIEKMIDIENVYIPKGFDSNDNVEIVVEGQLPNLCHQVPKIKANISKNKIQLKLTSLFYGNRDYYCPPAIVPFLVTANLGVLKAGTYDVMANNEGGRLRKVLEVSVAPTTSIDDHIYANVDYLEKNMGENFITLKGYNVSDCFELDRINFGSNGTDTVSVLPIMKQVNDFCPRKMTPFEYTVEVPRDVNEKKVLLHVRTMNGKSYNKLITTK